MLGGQSQTSEMIISPQFSCYTFSFFTLLIKRSGVSDSISNSRLAQSGILDHVVLKSSGR